MWLESFECSKTDKIYANLCSNLNLYIEMKKPLLWSFFTLIFVKILDIEHYQINISRYQDNLGKLK